MPSNQTPSQSNGNAPSAINMTRQSQRSSSHPESGEETTSERGSAIENKALARARSLVGNQCERRMSVAGYIPPSATPSSNRITQSSCQFRAKPQPAAQQPQTTNEIATNRFVLQWLAR